MALDLTAYIIVAVAAGWIGWSMLLRGRLRRRTAKRSGAGGGSGCNCGD